MSQPHSPDTVFSEGYACLENPSLPLNVTIDDLSSNRDAWKFDKDCSLCGIAFGVLKLQHKYRCKFCYRGICAKCSKRKVLHPEQGLERRCCNACYEKFISSTMREELEGKLSISQARMSRIERKLTNVQDDRADAGEHSRKLTFELNRLRLQQTKLDSELEKVLGRQRDTFEKLKKQRKLIEAMREEKKGKVCEIRTHTEKRRREIENLNKLVSDAVNAIAQNKTELAQIQDEEVALMRISAERSQAIDTANRTAKELKSALIGMESKCRMIETQNESAKSQLYDLESDLKSIDVRRTDDTEPVELITRTRGDGSSSSYGSDIDIEKDKERYRELMEENYELRRQYQDRMSAGRLAFVIKTDREEQDTPAMRQAGRETTRDPRACGCLLF